MRFPALLVLPVLVLGWTISVAQSFQNLDFEQADVSGFNPLDDVPITKALPYWNGVLGGLPANTVVLDGNYLDGGALGLYRYSAIFGSYSAYLQDDWVGNDRSLNVELAQTGVIPTDAKSLRFYTKPFSSIRFFNPRLTLEDFRFWLLINGQKTDFSPIEVTPNWVQWGADVSRFAGTLSEIRFSLDTPYSTNNPPPAHDVGAIITLDNISFSPEPFVALVGEPPQSQSTFKGATVSFKVTTIVAGPFTYQWQFNGTDLPGETNDSLILRNVRPDQSGKYAVVLSNALGVARSPDATLTVTAVAAWGDDYHGQTTVPADLTNVLAVSAGDRHSVALLSDRTVRVWGDNTFGQKNVPTWVSNVTAISGGAPNTLALLPEGRVGSWGPYGGALVTGLSNAVAVSGNGNLALRPDGTVVSWTAPGGGFQYVPDTRDVVAIAPGMALNAYGTVKALGDTNVPAGLSNVVAIASASHRLALRSDGTVVAWGDNSFGQTSVPADLTDVVAIAAGFFHSLALKADGTVVAWGAGKGSASSEFEHGQSNVPEGLTNVIAISANGYHSLALVGDGPPSTHVAVAYPTWTTNGCALSVPSQSGRVYRLDYRDFAADGNWAWLPLTAGSGSPIRLVDPNATNAQRFYRVSQW